MICWSFCLVLILCAEVFWLSRNCPLFFPSRLRAGIYEKFANAFVKAVEGLQVGNGLAEEITQVNSQSSQCSLALIVFVSSDRCWESSIRLRTSHLVSKSGSSSNRTLIGYMAEFQCFQDIGWIRFYDFIANSRACIILFCRMA